MKKLQVFALVLVAALALTATCTAVAGKKKIKTTVTSTYNPSKAVIKTSLDSKKSKCLFGREVILKNQAGEDVADALSDSKGAKFDASKLDKGDYTVVVPKKKEKKFVCGGGEASVLVF